MTIERIDDDNQDGQLRRKRRRRLQCEVILRQIKEGQ